MNAITAWLSAIRASGFSDAGQALERAWADAVIEQGVIGRRHAAGADDVPVNATIVVTDGLPGTSTTCGLFDFVVVPVKGMRERQAVTVRNPNRSQPCVATLKRKYF